MDVPRFNVPGAVGPVYAPVKAYIEKELWKHLPHRFLNSAIVANHFTETLLEGVDIDQSLLEITVVTNADPTDRHPVLPITSIGRRIKENLFPILFNTLIDVYTDEIEDLFVLTNQ